VRAEQFRSLIRELPYGKVLPTAYYILRPQEVDVPRLLFSEIRRAEIAACPAPDWNLLKLHLDQAAITFLSYPEFDCDPHPALAEATKINLTTGTVVRTNYRTRANPPILHRKETFLAPSDPRRNTFEFLTSEEEKAGLYANPAQIGLKQQWATLLRRLGLGYEGHSLIYNLKQPEQDGNGDEAVVERHRTAIKRYDLSKPVKQLLERGLLRKQDTFFDFGCGHGMDVQALRDLSYEASGWDPAFHPEGVKEPADVVNLGYVLNVIEEPVERVEALREAFSLSKRLLLVSTLVAGQESDSHTRPYRDGFLTKTNTFQKFYAPGELEGLIEQTLEAEAITLGLGLCVVFREAGDAELFEATRNRRRIDWSEIGAQLKFATPASREKRTVDRYELHRELFDKFWLRCLELGRAPEAGEFNQLIEVRKAAGGVKRALALVMTRDGEELWKRVRKERAEDVLVYLAMTNFRTRFLRREIPSRTKHDINEFFGDLQNAQAKAKDILFAAGDPGEIDLACASVEVGWQDRDALMIHRSLLEQLPPILRVYVHCAAYRYGDPTQADIIKIHKHSGKITFQHYEDFDGKPLPELQTRIKVNLRNLFVEVFDHSRGPRIQLLFFKERFVGSEHPNRQLMEKFSSKVRKLGFDESTIGLGPDKDTFRSLLAMRGLNENLNSVKTIL
jgi:DNA phosphorothioation-associated putative methyltransferase